MNLFIFQSSTVQTKKSREQTIWPVTELTIGNYSSEDRATFSACKTHTQKSPNTLFSFFFFFLTADLFFVSFSFSFHNCSPVGKAYFCVSLSQYSAICIRVRGEKEKRNTETASDIQSDLLY